LRRLRTYLSILLIICLSWKAEAQTLTYSFLDPCTKEVTFFSVPAQGTTIFFLGQSRSFVPGDVQNGTLAAWINQVYADYRKVAPCSQQSGQVTQNQITSQIIGNTVQSVVGSIMSQAQSAAAGTMQSVTTSVSNSNSSSAGASDAPSKNNKDESKNTSNQSNTSNNSNNNSSGTNSSGNNSNTGGNSGSTSNNSQSQNDNKKEEKGEEVAATTTMNVDQQNQNDAKSDNSSSGGKGGKSGSKGGGRTNPLIVSSDLTTAQNLDRSFTPILNLSMSQSSMTGMSSWGLTSMVWFNFRQFALSGKYTKINFSKNGKLKWVHNVNLTGVYTYGNILGFVGYSGILNAGKYGVTGFNISAAATLITEDKNTFVSPSITAFYTKPFTTGKRFTISPELYIISTPLIYSTKEKITTTDRTFSAFIGSGFDYQLTRRFKFNMNYKANMSTNPDFPILSFFLIGSKINL
jgi:hypothetical protein